MTLAEQEETGAWLEEVQKLVDGCLDDVRSGQVGNRAQVVLNLASATQLSKYVQEHQLALVTLLQTTEAATLESVRTLAASVLWDRAITEMQTRPEYQQLA